MSAAGPEPVTVRSRPGLYVTLRLPVAMVVASLLSLLLPGPRWWDLVGVNGAVALALLLDVVVAPRPGSLQASRTVPDVVSLGQTETAVLRLHNPTGRRLRVATHDAAAPSMGLAPTRQAAVLGPQAWETLEASLAPRRRGRTRVGPLTVRTGGPLGLGGRQRRLPLVSPLKCYPALPGRKEVELRAERARLLQSGERPVALRGGSCDFDSLREYHPDDEFRRINWRATARSTKPISNTYREERNQQVLLLVDASRTMAATVAGVPRFEHALDAGIAVAELAGRAGDHVGMEAFASDVLVTVAPRSGRAQAQRILDLLFDLHPSLDAPNYARAFSSLLARHRRRALLILLTDILDQAVMEDLFQALPMLLARHLLVVAGVTDPAVEVEAERIPSGNDDAYRKAAAAGRLAARADAAARLSWMGATVIDRPPGQLAGALADCYLTIKARGRL